MIRVLVVDDSPTARALIVAFLSSDPDVLVVGEAADGFEALAAARQLRPDVITMDVHMPRLDGFGATKQIMVEVPVPVVIVTSLSLPDVEAALHALGVGAVAAVMKPARADGADFDKHRRELIESVKAMADVKVVRHLRPGPRKGRTASRARAASIQVMALAASTGGPPVLQQILSRLPRDFGASILVVQHIAKGFVDGLARWLSSTSALPVVVASDGDRLRPGVVYLAPDEAHLGLDGAMRATLSTSAPVGGFRPSATILFESLAKTLGPHALGVILTGMGDDGVAGLGALQAAGGETIAQDEASCLVYGMPGAAVRAGVVSRVLKPGDLADYLTQVATPAPGHLDPTSDPE